MGKQWGSKNLDSPSTYMMITIKEK